MAYTYTNRNEPRQQVVAPQAIPRLDWLPNWDRVGKADPLAAKGKDDDSDAPPESTAYPLPPASAQKPRWIEYWTGHPDASKRMTEEEASARTRDQLADLARPKADDGDTED